ncbi:hypothetical protein [Mesorhizobium sp. NZP2077]|uniref:hypothetical protein n=1 Tax=Mesorhizobium sp. NZP2077 TaxID=2483404 RepID=UPI001554E9E2|nr:hypothetical protein [Mesorhizobium sp. NZP2077]QKC84029.1 hypothetical protein EB232_22680 [Mesorhizobium sp. NZP2077]QKD17568.1 hypothetical protein HGP13_22380 [Mesorhizobium sp. NZP2077]
MIARRVIAALLVALFVMGQSSGTFGGSLQQLSQTDKAAFDNIVSALDNWRGDAALLLKSGRYLRSGNLPKARSTLEQASLVGIDQDYAKNGVWISAMMSMPR